MLTQDEKSACPGEIHFDIYFSKWYCSMLKKGQIVTKNNNLNQ